MVRKWSMLVRWDCMWKLLIEACSTLQEAPLQACGVCGPGFGLCSTAHSVRKQIMVHPGLEDVWGVGIRVQGPHDLRAAGDTRTARGRCADICA